MHFATEFWLSRLCFQRALGGIYLIAFLIAASQFIPLLGTRGLQPVRVFVRHVPFRRAPSLFYINCSDRFITAIIWCGVIQATGDRVRASRGPRSAWPA